MSKFEPNTIYFGRFTCNYDSIVTVYVTRVSEKSVWYVDQYSPNEVKRAKIRHSRDCESFSVGTVGIYSDKVWKSEDKSHDEILQYWKDEEQYRIDLAKKRERINAL